MKNLLKIIFTCFIFIFGTTNKISAKSLGFGIQLGGGITIPIEHEASDREKKGVFGNGKYCFNFIPYIEYIYEDFYIGARIAIKYSHFAYDTEVIDKDSKTNPKSKTTFSLNHHYASIPILFQINPVEPLSINIGPEFFFRISSNQEKDKKESKTKIDRAFKNFCVGALINIEYEVMGINFGLEGGMTFSGIDEYKNEDEKIKNKLKSNNIFYSILKIGYNFAYLIKDNNH